ncbi:MAG: dipeptidase [Nocardioidaceae bacterium]
MITDTSAPATYIFDGHNDLPWAMRDLCGYDLDDFDLVGGDARLHTDVPRLQAGGVGAQFWSVFVPCSLTNGAAVTATLEQIDFVRRMVARHPNEFSLVTTAAEVELAVRAGRVASLMGMEGGHSIDSSLGTLRMMHELGVRYMTLTHNENVPWADSATDSPVAGGLTDFGREVVREMNRIGMFVDLSHVSADVMRDALATSSAPVIFSHSCARAVCDISRNVPDDVLATLPANGGVCMVAFVPMFVSQANADWYAECLDLVEQRGGDRRRFADIDPVLAERMQHDPPKPVTADDVADQVEHVREVAGLDHVGLGGDYDGSTFFPEGMDDVAGYPRLLDALRKRGWSEDELVQLTHGNVLRALRGMEAAATA